MENRPKPWLRLVATVTCHRSLETHSRNSTDNSLSSTVPPYTVLYEGRTQDMSTCLHFNNLCVEV